MMVIVPWLALNVALAFWWGPNWRDAFPREGEE